MINVISYKKNNKKYYIFNDFIDNFINVRFITNSKYEIIYKDVFFKNNDFSKNKCTIVFITKKS